MDYPDDILLGTTGTKVNPVNWNEIVTGINNLKNYNGEYKVYDVKAYGAVGDGSTPDTTAFKDAITAAGRGGVVYVPPGNYVIDDALTISARRMTIQGAGYGTQIFQSADDHLFDIAQTGLDFTIRDMKLGSAATTIEKSLIYVDRTGGRIDRVRMYGGYYGLYLHGGLQNYVSYLQSYGNTVDQFFAAASCSENQTWVKAIASGGYAPNANFFERLDLSHGIIGFDYDGGSDGSFTMIGSAIQGGITVTKGVSIKNNGLFAIYGLHTEYSGGGSPIHMELENCRGGLIQGYTLAADLAVYIRNCYNITIQGSYVGGIDIDKHSRDITLDDMIYGTAGIVDNGVRTHKRGMVSNSGISYRDSTKLYSGFNLCDGDLEYWTGTPSLPVGFAIENSATIAAEGTIIKYGVYSAKVTIGAGKTRGGLYFDVSGSQYKQIARPVALNYRNAAYAWTLSSGGTSEYYLRTAAGADPECNGSPLTIYLNGVTAGAAATVGSLGAGEWGYDDNDSLGYDTIYVRLADSTDPDTKTTGYVEGVYQRRYITAAAWCYKPAAGSFTPTIYLTFRKSGATEYYNVFPVTCADDEWTRGLATAYLDPTMDEVWCCVGGYGAVAGEIAYFDGIEVCEGVGAGENFNPQVKTYHSISESSAGNVGVQTPAPVLPLQVKTNVFVVGTGQPTTWGLSGAGVGIATPDSNFEVHGTDANTTVGNNSRARLWLQNESTTVNTWFPIWLAGGTVGNGAYAGIAGQYTNNTLQYGAFAMLTRDADGLLPRLFIASDGKIGAGTIIPLCPVHIVGVAAAGTLQNWSLALDMAGNLAAGGLGFFKSGSVPAMQTFANADFLLLPSGGNILIGSTATATAKVDINSDVIRLRTSKTPSSTTATGNAGDICWDSGYVYVCISANSWRRATLGTW